MKMKLFTSAAVLLLALSWVAAPAAADSRCETLQVAVLRVDNGTLADGALAATGRDRSRPTH